MSTDRSRALFERAQKVLPGGVNSPVRAFKGVGGTPRFIERAERAYLIDADGTRYIDYVLAWGPMLLGHSDAAVTRALQQQLQRGIAFGAPTEAEVKLGEAIRRLVPAMERVRLVPSGTEAAMSALRLARAVTGRPLLLKFDGCYHGHADSFLVRAGSGAATLEVPDSPGVPPEVAALTRVARFNDLDSVKEQFARHPGAIAALFVEPVVGNYGVLPPRPGFLQGLRALCDAEGALLVIDEVMTGFRVARGGAQARYGVKPDLALLGKVIGGGLPIAAYGGRADLMERIAPAGDVYQAGTYAGHPLAVAAGLAALERVEQDHVCELAEQHAAALALGLREALAAAGIEATLNCVGSMWSMFFAPGPVDDMASVRRADKSLFAAFHAGMLARGVYLPPSAFESAFLSCVHTEADIRHTVNAAAETLSEMKARSS